MKKSITILFVFITIFSYSQNQDVTIIWERAYGGTQNDELNTIIQTADGGYLLGGSTESHNGDVQSGNFQSRDFWVVKINGDGDILWEKTYGGTQPDYLYSIIETTDNNYLVTGYTSSNDGNIQSGNKGEYDIWIFKISNEGTIIWEKTFGGSLLEYGSCILPTTDGGYLIGANSKSSDGDVEFNNFGNYDYWIFKIDANGNIIWQKTFGGSNRDVLYTMCSVSEDGSYMLCGYTRSNNGDIQSGNEGDYDIWIVNIDTVGNFKWEKTFGGSLYEAPRMIMPISNGYLIGGYTNSNDCDIQSGNNGGRDIWLIKIDYQGKLIWEKTYGGANDDYLRSFSLNLNGGYLLGGTTKSINGDIQSGNFGDWDFWVVNTNEKGEILWEKTYGGFSIDVSTMILSISENEFLVGGYTESDNGDIQSGNHGEKDMWLLKVALAPVTSIFDNELTNDNFILYPNPTDNYIEFEIKNNSYPSILKIYDIHGKEVLQYEITHQRKISVNKLKSGMYLYRIIQNEKQESGRLIIK